MDLEKSHLRLVRDPEPLGSYIRPLARDYRYAARLIASGLPVAGSLVVDACDLSRSEDLRLVAREKRIDVILDPRSVELSTPGGWTRSGVADLPWANSEMDRPTHFNGTRRRSVVAAISQTAIDLGASAVLAPTHYHDVLPSPWFEIDLQLAEELRQELDRSPTGAGIQIYFPLISRLSTVRSDSALRLTLDGLKDLCRSKAIDALWLRMHAFGTTNSGPLNLKRYLEFCRHTHTLGIPIVGERTGTIGLGLLAFGAVSGIESSITHGDRYEIATLRNPPRKTGRGFTIQPRIYLRQIGALLHREPAAEFLNSRGVKASFGCQLPCCERGIVDMLAEPRRHFLVTRDAEVRDLERVPAEARVEEYAAWLRRASDRATRAARVLPSLERHRARLDQWRATLSEIRERDAGRRPSVAVSIKQLHGRVA